MSTFDFGKGPVNYDDLLWKCQGILEPKDYMRLAGLIVAERELRHTNEQLKEKNDEDCARVSGKAEVKHLRDELERLLVRTPVGLELHEMDAIIDGNITITDSKLRDAIYAVVLDTMHTVMEKNGLMPE
jgi:hypothetical protein